MKGYTEGASEQRVLAGGAAEDEAKQRSQAVRARKRRRRRNLHIPLLQGRIRTYPHLCQSPLVSFNGHSRMQSTT